jgi:peptidoglycan/xylan/chitin deacetylase (PgdA/CDA1 family)
VAVTLRTSRIPFADRAGLDAWPGGARLAVLVYAAPEQWLWDAGDVIRPAGTFAAGRNCAASPSTTSAVAYGFAVGLPRLREVFAEFGMQVTLWTSGLAALEFPDVLAAMVADGHELGGHGFAQGQVMAMLSRAEQEDSIGRSVAALQSVTGQRPAGWVSPAAESNQDTIELLAAAGFTYHGDLQDDELPYFVHAGDKIVVEIPYRLVGNLNDLSILTRNVTSVSTAAAHLCDAFDAYYAAAAVRPLIFSYGMHPYISGRPDNAMVLRRLLEHIHSRSGVWVTTYAGMAGWWRERFEQELCPASGGAPGTRAGTGSPAR